MLLSIIVLASEMGLKYVDPNDLDRLRLPDGEPAARTATTSTP